MELNYQWVDGYVRVQFSNKEPSLPNILSEDSAKRLPPTETIVINDNHFVVTREVAIFELAHASQSDVFISSLILQGRKKLYKRLRRGDKKS